MRISAADKVMTTFMGSPNWGSSNAATLAAFATSSLSSSIFSFPAVQRIGCECYLPHDCVLRKERAAAGHRSRMHH